MTDRENIINYFIDIAKRHVDIAHDPAQTKLKDRRFFHMETIDLINSGAQANLVDWFMVLEGIEGRLIDNRGDHPSVANEVAFLILKHCKSDDLAQRRSVYNAAYGIGMDIIAKIRTDVAGNARSAIGQVPGSINCPFTMPVASVKFHEVGQPLFVNHIGYRFTMDLITDRNISLQRDNAKWTDIS